jgi:hypothetical protein
LSIVGASIHVEEPRHGVGWRLHDRERPTPTVATRIAVGALTEVSGHVGVGGDTFLEAKRATTHGVGRHHVLVARRWLI